MCTALTTASEWAMVDRTHRLRHQDARSVMPFIRSCACKDMFCANRAHWFYQPLSPSVQSAQNCFMPSVPIKAHTFKTSCVSSPQPPLRFWTDILSLLTTQLLLLLFSARDSLLTTTFLLVNQAATALLAQQSCGICFVAHTPSASSFHLSLNQSAAKVASKLLVTALHRLLSKKLLL